MHAPGGSWPTTAGAQLVSGNQFPSMGVYTRADSKFFWLHLERTGQPGIKQRTSIRCDAPDAWQRKQNRQLAEQLYHVRMSALARGELEGPVKATITFEKFAAWYEQHVLPKHRGQERERQILPRLVRDFGAYDLTQISKKLVTEWQTRRLATPTAIAAKKRTKARTVRVTANTVNRETDVLKSVLQAAVPEYLEASPLYGMKRLHTLTPKRRLLEPDEEARILRAMSPADRALFLLGSDSLVRLGDILDIKREDDRGDRIWIRDPKTGGGFEVPISTRTRKALDKIRDDGSGYYFSLRRRAETEANRRTAVRHMLERACKAAKPPVPYGRVRDGITFHWATRRTGATRMIHAGIDLGTVQKVGRWAQPDVVLGIYHELIDERARAAVEAVSGTPASPPDKKQPARKRRGAPPARRQSA